MGRIFKKNNLLELIGSYGILFSILLLVIIITSFNKSFFSINNLVNLVEQYSSLAIIAAGVTFVMISGSMDLSPGSLIALCSVITGITYTSTGSIVLSLIFGIFAGALIGGINGILVSKAGLSPIIVTLAAMIWTRGLAMAITMGNAIPINNSLIKFLNRSLIFGFTPKIIFVVFVYVISWIVLKKTKLGRYTYAIGGNEVNSRQVGLNVDLQKIYIFSISGFLAGVASLLTISRFAVAQPTIGQGMELDAIVSAIVGGNSLKGGRGGVEKTIIGVLFISILSNSLSILGVTDYYLSFIKGTAILLALLIELSAKRVTSGIKLNVEGG